MRKGLPRAIYSLDKAGVGTTTKCTPEQSRFIVWLCPRCDDVNETADENGDKTRVKGRPVICDCCEKESRLFFPGNPYCKELSSRVITQREEKDPPESATARD